MRHGIIGIFLPMSMRSATRKAETAKTGAVQRCAPVATQNIVAFVLRK
jgi:hypothetical protein